MNNNTPTRTHGVYMMFCNSSTLTMQWTLIIVCGRWLGRLGRPIEKGYDY